MTTPNISREEMWAQQGLLPQEIDYRVWERDKTLLLQMDKIYGSCTFVVDVCKGRYTFASSNFVDLLGYDRKKTENIEQDEHDYLESHIHPDDLEQIKSLQVDLGHFIYRQAPEERNHYRNILSYRMRNADGKYVQVTSKQQVMEASDSGKAWLILGVLDIASDQRPQKAVSCTVLNRKTASLLSPFPGLENTPRLSPREIEVLQEMRRGFLSKEISCHLNISIHTVNIHRQNIFRKLSVQNAIEAINAGVDAGFLS